MPYIAVVVHATCCGHPVAEVMLVLWALGHLIEGASGFGTGPATLTREPLLARVAAATAGMCAPSHGRHPPQLVVSVPAAAPPVPAAIMAALGYPPFESLVCLLIMTTWWVGAALRPALAASALGSGCYINRAMPPCQRLALQRGPLWLQWHWHLVWPVHTGLESHPACAGHLPGRSLHGSHGEGHVMHATMEEL